MCVFADQVRPPASHRVCQIYASAVPVAYAKSTTSRDWESFARLVLRGAYRATLGAAALKAARQSSNASAVKAEATHAEDKGGGGPPRVTVFLTALGGGAFGNRVGWIQDAINGALSEFRNCPLDVVLVHYGSVVQSNLKGIALPPAGNATAAVYPALATAEEKLDSEEPKERKAEATGQAPEDKS